MANPTYAKIFAASSKVNVSISLEDFTLNKGEEKDFRVSYAFSFKYFDTTPESIPSNISFSVKQNFTTADLGLVAKNGKIFTYAATLTNKKSDSGVGMTVAIIRVPSCLDILYDNLELLKRNKQVDYYEIRNQNTEITLYWRAMRPAETKTINIDLIQRFNGQCLQKPHTAYLYYNNDAPIWILPVSPVLKQ